MTERGKTHNYFFARAWWTAMIFISNKTKLLNIAKFSFNFNFNWSWVKPYFQFLQPATHPVTHPPERLFATEGSWFQIWISFDKLNELCRIKLRIFQVLVQYTLYVIHYTLLLFRASLDSVCFFVRKMFRHLSKIEKI